MPPMSEPYENLKLGDLADLAAARWGDREALCFEDRRWTFAEFAAEVDRCAKGLIALGVEPGERVALWMTNRPEWLVAMVAIAKIGAALVPLNTRYRTDDVAYTLAQSHSATLIVNARSGPVDYAAMLAEAMPDLGHGALNDLGLKDFPVLKRLVVVGDHALPNAGGWDAMLAAGDAVDDAALAARAAAVTPDDVMMIGYTSGTTGHPKGAEVPHVAVRNTAERAQLFGMTERDVVINYLPLFHLYGMSDVAMMSLLTGTRQVLMDTFDADRALDLAEAEGATMLHGFEAHWADLLAAQDARPRKVRLRLGTFPSGTDGAVRVAARVQDVFGPTCSGWGMTEAWAFVIVSRPEDTAEQRVHASGRPMPGYEMRVIDPESDPDNPKDQPTDTPGELWVRGYAQMRGYFDKPEATADFMTEDGWLKTGDMARIRPDGHLVFMGRYKDMLKIGGENVSPAEIEARLAALDGVREAAVVGMTDDRLGEVPVAFLVRDHGAAITEPTILESCHGRIASFKIPRHIFFVAELPMTPSGKVRKVELREQARQLVAAAE